MKLEKLNEAQKMLALEYFTLCEILKENHWLIHYMEVKPKIERERNGVRLTIESCDDALAESS